MVSPQGYFRIGAWYLLLRILLTIRHHLEVLHLWIGEVPIWAMGSLHSYAMYALFRIWEQVDIKLFHLDNYLRYETYADEFFWMPGIEYSPIGYG